MQAMLLTETTCFRILTYHCLLAHTRGFVHCLGHCKERTRNHFEHQELNELEL
jgi:hypothetical protein